MQAKCHEKIKPCTIFFKKGTVTDVQIITHFVSFPISGSSTTKMSSPTKQDARLSHEQVTFIEQHLCTKSSSIIEAKDSSLYSILLFNPLQEHGAILTCPRHGHPLQDTGIWTHMRSMRRPRYLYGLGENILLISSIYACSICGDDLDKDTYMAHHPDLMRQLSGRYSPPFHLFQSSGVTMQAYEMVVTSALSGTPFAEIETSFQRLHGFHIATYGRSEHINVERKHASPSRFLCQNIFMHDYELRRPYYEGQMKQIKPSEFSVDHTFNTRYGYKFIITSQQFYQNMILSANSLKWQRRRPSQHYL